MKNFFSLLQSRETRRRKRTRGRQRLARFESLEPRHLLAGNVTAAVVDGDLRLTGDSLDNTAMVSVIEGDVVVEGLDDTTINGSDAPFTAFSGSGRIADDLLARLGRGSDVLLLAGGLEVADRVSISGGSGSVRVGLDAVTVGGTVGIFGTPGDDVVHFSDVEVAGDVRMRLRQGDDVVNLSETSVDDLAIRTARGDDAVILDPLTSAGDVNINTGSGSDDLVIKDSDIGDDLVVRTRTGHDFVMIDPSTIGDRFVGRFGRGNDNFVDRDGNRYGSVSVRSGRGRDAADFDAATTIDGPRVVQKTESGSVPDSVIDTRLNDPDIGALTRATAAAEFFAPFLDDPSENTTPTTSGIDDVTVEENAQDVVIDLFDAFDDAEDPDADLIYAIDGNTNEALFSSTPINAAAGTLVLDFAPDTTGTAEITVSATDTGGFSEETLFTVTVNPAGVLTLTVDTSANETIESNDTLLTNDPTFNIAGTTSAGATVDVDRDSDGAFDDGTTTADALGNYSLDVTLIHNDDNHGANALSVRARRDSEEVSEDVNVHLAEGTVVRYDSTLGSWDVELFDADAPNTVAAVLEDLSRYDATVVHRNVDEFVIQGGSFSFDAQTPAIVDAPDFPRVPNEFAAADPPNSNERGTLSTAQTSNPDSFSGGWFFNVVDNNADGSVNLDAVPHNPYGRVIGTGMTVVDAIQATPTFDIRGDLPNSGAFRDTPLLNYDPATGPPDEENFVTINSVTKILDPPGTTPNTFAVFENTAEGTVIGRVVAENGATESMVYQIDDPSLPDALKLGVVDHMVGDPTARAVIVEYLDLECPACKALHPTIRQLEQDFESDLLVVTRHLPLTSVHPRAFDAAIASEAADRQGMFDEMVDKLFETQGEPGEWTDPAVMFQARIEVYALELGLDLAQFRADQADPALVDRVNRDLDSAASLGATSTPTVYLNGMNIASPLMNVGDYADLIQDELDAFDDPFLLNRDNGDIIVADSGQLDFETNPTFTLEICATNGSTQQITSTINLIDVAE